MQISPGPVDSVSADLSTVAGATAVAEQLRTRELVCSGVVAAAGGLTAEPDPARLEGVRTQWQASFDADVLTAVLLVEAVRRELREAGGCPRRAGRDVPGRLWSAVRARPTRWPR